MAVPEIERVPEEALPVRADVEHDGQGSGGVYAGRGGVDGELAGRDGYAAHAPVADPKDRLAVGCDDQVDVLRAQSGCAKRALDVLGPVDREVDAARAPVLARVMLDRLSDGGGVDDRQHLGEVFLQETVEEHLVAVRQEREEDVLTEVGALAGELRVGPVCLLFDGGHAWR